MEHEQDRGTFVGPLVISLIVALVLIVAVGVGFFVYTARLRNERERAYLAQVQAERAMVAANEARVAADRARVETLRAQKQAETLTRERAEARADAGAPAANPRSEVSTLPPGVLAHKNLEYVRAGEQDLQLDLYIPVERIGKPPLLVWIHGGGWRQGSKDWCPLVWLTRHGYAVASIQYRLSGQAIFPAQIHDCKAAIRWLRAHAGSYGYDSGKIGVAGISAGGHLATLLGTSAGVKELEGSVGEDLESSSRVQAVVNMCGASDFPRIMEHFPQAVDDPESTLAQLFGGPFSQRKALARLASPATHVGENDSPLLLIHGEKDPLVPLDQSEYLRDLYVEAKLEARLETIPGAVHATDDFWDRKRQASVRDFFDAQLKGER